MSIPGMPQPGNADVPVGPPAPPHADEDVGAPRESAPRRHEWYSRGYLPHRDAAHLIQSVTYRLADSLPQEKLKLLDDELALLAGDQREREQRKRIEAWLDAGMGCCALRHPEVARYIQESFLSFHGKRYSLHAWCIMPNHVHVLLEPRTDLATIVQGWKSFTSRWVLRQNQWLGLRIPKPDQLWMREYWDRYIRDAGHYQKALDYIQQNPVKAGLCRRPEDWPWSSAAPVNAVGLPGNADVPVGPPSPNHADEDVGAPRNAPCPNKTKDNWARPFGTLRPTARGDERG